MAGISGEYIYDERGRVIGATGAKKAKLKVKEKYGKDFYREIGRIGGKRGKTGGFASKKKGKDGLTGIERASIAGKIGGKKSKRGKKNEKWYFSEDN